MEPTTAFHGRRARDRNLKRLSLVYGFLAACLFGYVIAEIVRRHPQSSTLVDGWGVSLFELIAALLCISRALRTDGDRITPLVLGLGLLAWSVGDITLTTESLGGATVPSPSLADAFYLCFYPLTYAGVILLARRQVRRITAATWLDGAVAGIGAAAICALFSFKSFNSLGGSAASVATNLAYPVGDLVLLAIVVGGSTVLPGRRKARWLLLATGYAINAVGDTFNLFQSSIGATHFGTVVNAVAWPTSILLVSLSVWLPSKTSNSIADDRAPGLAVPGVAALGALAILVLGSFSGGNPVAFGLAVLTLVIAGIRSAISLVYLRTLTEQRHGQAITDQLTTLGNRRALFELLDRILGDGADAGNRSLAFLFVDLNRFKEVNDSFGHFVGDELLRQLGLRLKGSLRSSDLLVRLGGDEFGVALLDADADYGATIAQRITARLEEPFQLGHVKAQISASIGIAVVPSDATEAHDLLRSADLAMYRAKTEGKCFAIYNEELDGYANRFGLVEELRLAIESAELDLHYQPQVDLATGAVVAVEALVRWAHPRLGSVPPLEFLPLAEDAGLMEQLTELVLDKALAQCARWRQTNPELAVSVNISTTNLVNGGFPRRVAQLLSAHHLAPDALVLEITETVAMSDFEQCKRTIMELRDLGITVSVDDFGAGFTSLAYLSSLAVNELKLDRSFIRGLSTAEESRDRSLIRATISLAHALGIRVVAEGVEDKASLDLLSSFDCDVAQGYLISKPKPAEEVVLRPRQVREAPAVNLPSQQPAPSAAPQVAIARLKPSGQV